MSRKLPPLLALRVFECAARHLSFTRAADELCVTQAAVSHQIRALEVWFGKPLFHRLNRTLKLTEAGERLLDPMSQAFDIIADVTGEVAAEEGRNVLIVSMLDSFATLMVLPRLKSFRNRFPDIDLRFVSRPLEEDVLVRGDADVEIRYGDGRWPGMHVYEFLKEELFPVCAPSVLEGRPPLADLAEIEQFDLIHDVLSVDWQDFLGNFGVTTVNTRRGFGFNHSHLVIQACIEGNGFALGRSALVAPALLSGELVRPFEQSMKSEYSYYIVCRPADSDKACVKAFAYWLMDEIESLGIEVIKGEA